MNPPSSVLAVMMAEPLATPVTRPEELTVAMPLLLLVHAMLLLVALDGVNVAVS